MTTHADYQQFKGERSMSSAKRPGKLAPTTLDIEGPFYKANAPFRADNRICPGADLVISGQVFAVNGSPLTGAVLDVWQADANGDYDCTGFNFRAKVRVRDYDGVYTIHTIRPGDYKISEPGQPDDFRCAHIHFKVTAPGYKPLTTQLYFPDDPYNATDHWFAKERVIGPDGRFDFVLEKDGDK